MTLKLVEIILNEESNEPLIILDDALSAAMMRVGAALMMLSGSDGAGQDSSNISPGGRNVAFVCIELENRTVPASLKHRMIFSSTPAGTSHSNEVALEDFQVPLSPDSASMLSSPFTGGI